MNEPNMYLENIKLLSKYNEFHIDELKNVQADEGSLEEESSLFNYFMEELQRLESQAKKDGKNEIETTEEFRTLVKKFQEHHWKKIITRHNGAVPEHRNPFPEYCNSSLLRVDDITSIKGRLAYLTNQQDHVLAKHARKYQTIINDDYHCTNMMTHQNARDPMIKRCIENQKVR